MRRASPTGFWATILFEDFNKHGRRRSVTEIANSMGVSERTLRHYMKGQAWPPLDLAFCVCQYLGLTIEDAVGNLECRKKEGA